MRGTRGPERLIVAVVIAITASLGATTLSSADPSSADLEAAKAKLGDLNQRLSLLIEQYNVASSRLDAVEARLRETRATRDAARRIAERARADLAERASAAYQGVGLQVNLLLGAQNLADLTDRLQFMNSLSQSDADLATTAQTAEQRAQWAAERFAEAAQEQQTILDRLGSQRSQIQGAIREQDQLIDRINAALERAARARRAAARAAAQQVGGPTGDTSGSPPPANTGAAQAAVNAAYSVLGTPYQWGGSSPDTGFDCSGLTSWAWGQAGVSLPHSSAAQYSVLPHLSRDQLQPGDLVFFYSPISHVGLYIGGGRMIDANHPGDVVAIRPVTWDAYVGAGRPG